MKWLMYFFFGYLLSYVYKIRKPEFSTGIIATFVTFLMAYSISMYNWSRIGDLSSLFGFYTNSFESVFSLRSVFAIFSIIIFIYGLNNVNKYMSLYLSFCGLLFIFMSGNRKSLIGLFILFLFAKIKNRRFGGIVRLVKISVVIFLLILSPLLISTKIMQSSLAEYSNVDQPRVFAYIKSFEIAKDYFPIGSGPATFASKGSRVNYSPIYEEYDMDSKWGFGEDDDVTYALDTYWAKVIGQYGMLGTVLIFLIFFFISKFKYQNSGCVSNLAIVLVFLFLAITTPVLQRTEAGLFIFFIFGVQYNKNSLSGKFFLC